MSQNQNPKYKIKEFEWFEMETKVRQIIQEVLGPLQKRILENSSVINKLKFSQTEDEKKIEEVALMIANDPKVFETGIFLTVEKRFEGQQKKIQELSRQIEEENKYVDEKFKILDLRMQESSQVLQNVAAMRERVAKEMQLQNENINSIRTNIEKMIDDLNTDIRTTRQTCQKNLQNCEKADYDLSEGIGQNSMTISGIQETLKTHNELHREAGCFLQSHNEKLKKFDEEIAALQDSKALTKKLNDYIKDLENQIRKYDFKLTTLSPLITQAQISDCLYHVLPQKMKKRIAIHEYKKYFKLNRDVLQKEFSKIGDRFHGIQLLQEMQKRNTKEIIQMKRKKLLSMGIDIDHLTYEQRERYYNEMVLEDTIDDGDEEVRVTAKVDEKEVLTIVDKHFKTFTNSIAQKIAIQLEDSKKYLYGIEEEIRIELQVSDNKFAELKEFGQTYQTEQLLENKSFVIEIRRLEKNIEMAAAECEYLKSLQKSLYNFCSLVNHLQIQDQIDKQNISLMGLQEHNADSIGGNQGNHGPGTPIRNNSIMELDKKCFSCCGYPATSLSAFKMACLAYSPSPIIIDSNQYKREELLEFTTNVLQGIKRLLQANGGPREPQQPENAMESNSGGMMHEENAEERHHTVTGNSYTPPKMEQLAMPDRKPTTGNKFRRTKKYSLSMTKNNPQFNLSRSTTKNKNGMREDMLNVSYAFNELRKRNMTFLI